MRIYVIIICLLVLATILRAQASDGQQLPFIFGKAFHVMPQTHNHESGYFSLCEGLNGKLYVGTTKYGVNSYLVELDPRSGAQRIVIDTNKLCKYTGAGYAAQSKIHTKNFLAPSGVIYVGSKQGYPEADENPESYPGGFIMSYNPRTDSAKSYGMLPYHGYGLIDVAADESRRLIYYVCRQDDALGDHMWGIYDMRARRHQLLGPHTMLYASTLFDAQGRAYVITHDFKLASYNPDSKELTIRDILLDKKPFNPVRGVSWHTQLMNWVMAPDGQTAYLLMLTSPNLYRIELGGDHKATTAIDLGKMVQSEKGTSTYGSLVMHPDGNAYALFVMADPAGRASGNLNVLARYEPATKTMRTLGALAIRNKDYFDFSPLPDGTPKPWSSGVETLPDGTLAPTTVHMGMIAARDGTLYATLLSPFAVLEIDDYRFPPENQPPCR